MGPFTEDSPKPVSGGGDVYAAYIKSLLDHEEIRKSALEAKASAVVNTSGVLVTLLFGLVAVVTGAKSFKLPEASRGSLTVAVILFVIATGLAVATAIIPSAYGEATFSPDHLRETLHQSASDAIFNVTKHQLQMVRIARQKNKLKVTLVSVAAVGELLGLVALAIAVILIVV